MPTIVALDTVAPAFGSSGSARSCGLNHDAGSDRMTGYDVVIVGGGPCGLAFARALDGSGLRVAIVEQQPREALANPPSDGRDMALTHRSANILRALGAWDAIDPEDISPLVMAKVSNGASPFALTFDTGGTPEDRLGWLVPNHRIREALFRVTEGRAGLDLLSGETVTAIRPARDGKLVELASGATLHAPLLIAADSRFSATRDQLGIPADITRLGHSMLVCRVAHEDDHRGIATEWFDYRQTIALLPLNGRKSSFVLTLPSAEIDRLARLDGEGLAQELTRRYRRRLGALRLIEAPKVYPLATTWARHFATARAALIGDAAVGMHPVTAHGFNLGLMGAAKLAGLVTRAAAGGRDIGSNGLLRRYELDHRLASWPIYTATNAIVGLYTARNPAAKIARAAGLRVAARGPIIRRAVSGLLMQH
jgi:ubiquinone biosynthesis UbiH/UbiF/VisC/COQ6 family hydroxylase